MLFFSAWIGIIFISFLLKKNILYCLKVILSYGFWISCNGLKHSFFNYGMEQKLFYNA